MKICTQKAADGISLASLPYNWNLGFGTRLSLASWFEETPFLFEYFTYM
jgi:hypothetical protein